MTRILLMLALTLALGTGAELAEVQVLYVQQTTEQRVADLVRASRLRVGLVLGVTTVAMKDPATGEVRGPGVDLGRALATRIGIEFVPVEHPRPGAVMEGLGSNAWDVAPGAIVP